MFAADRVLTTDLDDLKPEQLWQQIGDNFAVNEQAYIERLLTLLPDNDEARVRQRAKGWIQSVRQDLDEGGGIESLLHEFSLDSREGIALMTLAESLIRVPDAPSADALIEDRLCSAEWRSHKDKHSPLWLDMSSWALSRARNLYGDNPKQADVVTRMVKRLGEPLLRSALQQALSILAGRFVIGESIYQALDRTATEFRRGNSYSFDMLGEAALCSVDSDRYLQAYLNGIRALGQHEGYPQPCLRPAISVKLSALHPRFEALKGQEMLNELQVSMTLLIQQAREQDVAITIDAEEADRLEPTLELFQALYRGPARGWGNLGLAVQAYSKRALPVLCWLSALSRPQSDPIPVRLVKGAYWDAEIKHAQQLGLRDYPVYTRKQATDISYLACARYLLSEHSQGLHPQFATHNALTLSQLVDMSEQTGKAFECQRLFGMGKSLYRRFREQFDTPCRIYAPVGSHRELLPYLVRRLLENAANSSFVSQVVDPAIDSESLTRMPQRAWADDPSPGLPLPGDLFTPRINSRGLNLQIAAQRQPLLQALDNLQEQILTAAPLINGQPVLEGDPSPVLSPQQPQQIVGERYNADAEIAFQGIDQVQQALHSWRQQPAETRARILEQFADLLERHAAELIRLCVQEAGKTLQHSIDELREAVDFCRYYAQRARELMAAPRELPGITGERSRLQLEPRGLFVCISPWNFPLSIFVGQITAALVCGNGVVAKPAHQTCLIAYRCCQLLLEAGLPPGILALLTGPSSRFANALISHPAVAGVAFTGSTETAQHINRQLALRSKAPIAALLAETGGQNAMIADSTALAEQVVKDALESAFGSAGQRCSALRVLYLQEEVAEEITELLVGAMNQLHTGLPQHPETDIGPVIDQDALVKLQRHVEECRQRGLVRHQLSLPRTLQQGFFLPPTLIELEHIGQLSEEHFGPILHLIRYRADQLMGVIEEINSSGYGLTLSLHSRNENHLRLLSEQAAVGNVYINRNQTGAVVESHPFGGRGLSGTGPKAGGPHYLLHYLCEKTITTNTTAWGGNATLLMGGKG